MTYNLPRISANRPREIAGGNKGRGCANGQEMFEIFYGLFVNLLVNRTLRSFLRSFSYGGGGEVVLVNYSARPNFQGTLIRFANRADGLDIRREREGEREKSDE